ncbi:MAG: TPR end-of-group domain-containing protein [Candidatus Acidiferrales bacterium]
MKQQNWLGKHATQLQALAAFLVIVSFTLAGVRFLWRYLRTDLVVVVDWNESTVPPELISWANAMARGAAAIPPPSDDVITKYPWRAQPFQSLREHLSSPTGSRLSDGLYLSGDFDELVLEIQNKTDEPAPDVQLIVAGVLSLWDSSIEGPFVTTDEAESFKKQLPARDTLPGTLLLPRLPTMPAQSRLVIRVRGSLLPYPSVEVNAPGKNVSVRRKQKVEESFFLSIVGDPFGLAIILLSMFFLSLLLAGSTVHKETKGQLLYELARDQAKTGRGDEAISLLKKASDEGVLDKKKTQTEKDFEALRERDDFKQLIQE